MIASKSSSCLLSPRRSMFLFCLIVICQAGLFLLPPMKEKWSICLLDLMSSVLVNCVSYKKNERNTVYVYKIGTIFHRKGNTRM